jgi:methanethiol S-methyltransferase
MAASLSGASSRPARAFVWIGGALFVASLVCCTWWYVSPWGNSRPFAGASAGGFDAVLFGVFALHHSVFARDSVRRAIARWIPEPLIRSVYVWTASLLLIIVCVLWRPIGGDLYKVNGTAALANAAVELLGIWMIAESVRGLDPLELAGIRPARNRGLQIAGPYRLVRHPLYLGWVLAVFGHAHMTGDRLGFAVISTVYLVVAIPFEEASLVDTFGDAYRRYQDHVRWRIIPYVF